MSAQKLLIGALSFGVTLGILSAQVEVKPKDRPVFGQTSEPEKPAETSARPAPEEAANPTLKVLATWPSEAAQRTARDIVAAGAPMTPFLLENLSHADWKVRAASAYALGEAKERAAYAKIKQGMTELGNQIALGVYFAALAKIDPDQAPADLFPFVSGGSPSVSRDAFEAMPKSIAKSFAPKLREWLESGDDTLRERALELLRRKDGGEEWRTFFGVLGDKSARVAYTAANVLAESDLPEVHLALKDAATNSFGRPAAYAALALVLLEDRTQRPFLDTEGKFIEKMTRYLRMRGELENAVSAIALANVSMRSEAKELRDLADKFLVFQLIKSAAGGVIYGDYASVKTLCFKKAAMLTGENFGENAAAWKTWWNEAGSKFVALRRLSSLSDDGVAKATIEFRRRLPVGKEFTAIVSAAMPDGSKDAAVRPVFVAIEELKAIAAALRDLKFFTDDATAPSDDTDPIFVAVRIDRAERRRAFSVANAAALADLEKSLAALVEREKWQLLWNPLRDGDYAKWHAARKADVANLDDAGRDLWIAEKGGDAFAALDARGRRIALESWARRDPAWTAKNAARLVLLLTLKSTTAEQSKAIVRLLAKTPAGPERDALEASLLKNGGVDVETLFGEYVAAMSTADVKAHLADRRLLVRTVALRILAERPEDPVAVEAIVEKIGTFSPEMQEAVVGAFRGRATPILGALRTLAAATDHSGRLQAIEILGVLGSDEDVRTIKELGHTGGLSVTFAAMRALRGNAGTAAADALIDMAKTNADESVRREALLAVCRIESDHVREAMRTWLREEKNPAMISTLVGAVVPLFRKTLGEELSFLLATDDQALRRRVTLVLATVGQKESIPGLIALLLDPDARSSAEEYLFEITCKRIEAPNPEQKVTGWTAWWDSHKNEDADAWFVDALHERSLPVGDLLRFLRGEKDDPSAVALLVHCLRLDAWELRMRAHRYLTKISGTDQGSLTRISGPDDVQRIAEKWDKWQRMYELHR